MTEPTTGSDLAAIRTTAVREGDEWLLKGSKTFITNGHTGDFFVVATRTGERNGRALTLFGVEGDMNGLTRGAKLDKVGQPEAGTCELFFDDVRIPDCNLLGQVDRGFAATMERLPQERLSSAVTNIAHALGVLEDTVGYVKQRSASGKPIGSFQHNKFALARMKTELEAGRSFVDDGVMGHVRGELAPDRAAMAKLLSSDVQNRVIDGCVQLHGGYAYMKESSVARAWLDARVTRIWAGSNEIMQEVIGRSLGL